METVGPRRCVTGAWSMVPNWNTTGRVDGPGSLGPMYWPGLISIPATRCCRYLGGCHRPENTCCPKRPHALVPRQLGLSPNKWTKLAKTTPWRFHRHNPGGESKSPTRIRRGWRTNYPILFLVRFIWQPLCTRNTCVSILVFIERSPTVPGLRYFHQKHRYWRHRQKNNVRYIHVHTRSTPERANGIIMCTSMRQKPTVQLVFPSWLKVFFLAVFIPVKMALS